MFTDKRRFSLVSSHNGAKLCSGFFYWEEFLEKDAEMRKDSKGTMFYMYDPQVDSPLRVNSSLSDGVFSDIRITVVKNEEEPIETAYIFIPRVVAKGNMEEIYIRFTIPEHGTTYEGEVFHRKPRLTKVGREGWLISQISGRDI
jgi:hypothetical protein